LTSLPTWKLVQPERKIAIERNTDAPMVFIVTSCSERLNIVFASIKSNMQRFTLRHRRNLISTQQYEPAVVYGFLDAAEPPPTGSISGKGAKGAKEKPIFTLRSWRLGEKNSPERDDKRRAGQPSPMPDLSRVSANVVRK
jgi:hypothetical protein